MACDTCEYHSDTVVKFTQLNERLDNLCSVSTDLRNDSKESRKLLERMITMEERSTSYFEEFRRMQKTLDIVETRLDGHDIALAAIKSDVAAIKHMAVFTYTLLTLLATVAGTIIAIYH